MKNFYIMLLITSLTMGDVSLVKNPTLNILELQSSKILPNFQGQPHEQSNYFNIKVPHKQSNYFKYRNGQLQELSYIIHNNHQYEIIQINENSFRVLGSPIEWEVSK